MNSIISDFRFLMATSLRFVAVARNSLASRADLLVCDASLNAGLPAQPFRKASIKNRQSKICTEYSHGTF